MLFRAILALTALVASKVAADDNPIHDFDLWPPFGNAPAPTNQPNAQSIDFEAMLDMFSLTIPSEFASYFSDAQLPSFVTIEDDPDNVVTQTPPYPVVEASSLTQADEPCITNAPDGVNACTTAEASVTITSTITARTMKTTFFVIPTGGAFTSLAPFDPNGSVSVHAPYLFTVLMPAALAIFALALVL